jgi:hypothetical protein
MATKSRGTHALILPTETEPWVSINILKLLQINIVTYLNIVTNSNIIGFSYQEDFVVAEDPHEAI